MSKKNALGKGLGAIFPDLMEDPADKPHFAMCGIEDLSPNRFQPRKVFAEHEQKKLADSIKKNGLLQPILVRKSDDAAGYEIIAGERRWRAAQAAGLQDVPILIRHKTQDLDVAELSLIENIQREELNPLEESGAYHTLIETFHLSQEEISARVGKERSTIANSLRLLNLPREAKEALMKKEISAGHARAILSLDSQEEQIAALREIIRKKLSVREAEKLVKGHYAHPKKKKVIEKDIYITDLENKISEHLMARTNIKPLRKGGVIEIRFLSPNELDRLSDVIMGGDDQ
ncbi:MAG: ParB/RepB/Spo0J family partition protein [Syntrophales bacterium]|jgi:ParB family chromosome partitioning protein|nr:ParB/RepB/Spo0J family partition protein [Syntrophales bacterium]